jgi:DNA repair exonuclease SbcCD ATPase subunit
MNFGQIAIQNFMAISSAAFNLTDRGLFLVQGINDDDSSAESNGAGKSSLADALCWCLYGKTARGVSGDAVVNDSAKKDCFVRVQIIEDGVCYDITRYRKHKSYKNSLTLEEISSSGDVISLTKGTDPLTQKLVESIIGSSYDVFKSANYAGQEAMPDLPAMTDKFLKVLIEEAAGTTLLETAYEKARLMVADIKSAISISSRREDDIRLLIDETEKKIVDLKIEKTSYDESIKTKLINLMHQRGVQVEAIREVSVKIGVVNKASVEVEIADVRTTLDSVESQRAHERSLIEQVADLSRQIAVSKAVFDRTRKETETLKGDVVKIASRVGTPCDECGKPYEEHDIIEAKEIAKRKLSTSAKSLLEQHAVLEEQLRAHDTQSHALAEYRDKMTDVSVQNELLESLTHKIAEIVDLERNRDNIGMIIKNIDREIESVKISSSPNPYSRLLEDAEKTQLQREKEFTELIEETDKLKKDLKRYEIVLKVFSPAGVRAHILDTDTPFLNDRTSRYLSVFSDENITAIWTTLAKTAKGELREKFSIEVTNAKGGQSFAALSGGEKRKVRLATALALQDLVASRATKPINLFVADEIDHALDTPGLERLMMILEEKARECGSVLVISHNDLKHWISQIITVIKKDGKATIEECLI